MQQYSILNPVGLDKFIASANLVLSDITWLEAIYQRAYTQAYAQESTVYEPRIYLSQSEYKNPIPQDNIKAQSFWLATGPERHLESEPNNDYFENQKSRDVALIVSANLRLIDEAKDYIFTEELKEEVEVMLNRINGLEVREYIDEDIRQVFSGFNITEFNIMQYPYVCFRFNCTVFYGGRRSC